MGIRFTAANLDRVTAIMPVDGNRQLTGILHGGASCVLSETLGSVATWLHAGPTAQVAGVEINATHHRVAAEGVVTGVATPLHRGRTLATYDVAISDEAGQRVCTSRITCAIRRPG
jgi:uncharacterized protein (TIGR00369 family)